MKTLTWFETNTLECLINVPGRLFIFEKISAQDALIMPRTLIDFQDFSIRDVILDLIQICFSLIWTIFQRKFLINKKLVSFNVFKSLHCLKFWSGLLWFSKVFRPGRLDGPGRLLVFHNFSIQDAYSTQDVY